MEDLLQPASSLATVARAPRAAVQHLKGVVLDRETREERRLAEEVAGRVLERVIARAESGRGPPLEEIINEALYYERLRLSRARDGKRTEEDRGFWNRINRELPRSGEQQRRAMLRAILERYAHEIRGHFDTRVYHVATRALPVGLTLLLNGLSPSRQLRRLPDLPSMRRNIRLEGEVDTIRALSRRGTLILAPTHLSNLDSPLIGYAIYRMGLPPFTYGAGLNLFTNPITSFFMHNLGAYTVDRTKSDPLYREALKEYATLSLELGQHNLFFPGGTRSRAGAVERHLKKGLLGAGLVAFHNNLVEKKPQPRVFVFPCTLNYPLVLEAATLVEDYLEESGKSRYIIANDEFSRLKRWVDFLRGLFALDQRVHVVVGRPLDPFGNDVDLHGESLDPRGRVIDPARYLMEGGEPRLDPARDAEYTRMLASRVADAFSRDTVALPTHILAFAFLELLRRESKQQDLYRFLRSLGPEVGLPLRVVELETERLMGELRAKAARGEIRVCPEGHGAAGALVESAIRTLGSYHTHPVVERRGMRLHVGDAKLLFYYRNRLEGYGLLGAAPLLAPGRGR